MGAPYQCGVHGYGTSIAVNWAGVESAQRVSSHVGGSIAHRLTGLLIQTIHRPMNDLLIFPIPNQEEASVRSAFRVVILARGIEPIPLRWIVQKII